jgi:hypothetical protein
MDYFERLEVSRLASPETIVSAYRRLAKRHHPDVGCGFRTIPYSWNGRIRTPVSAFSYTRVRGLSQLLA